MIKYFHGYELSLVTKKFHDRTETLYFESLVTIVKIMHQSSPTPPPPPLPPPTFRFKSWLKADSSATPGFN